MSNETKDVKQSGTTEKVKVTQYAYVMQPPILNRQPSLQNARFNDKEMVSVLNNRFDSVLIAKKANHSNICFHKSNGKNMIRKNPKPFSEVLDQAYSSFKE